MLGVRVRAGAYSVVGVSGISLYRCVRVFLRECSSSRCAVARGRTQIVNIG